MPNELRASVERFIAFARERMVFSPHLRFFVSEVGCGYAGFSPKEVAPLFVDAPSNCDLPPGWRRQAPTSCWPEAVAPPPPARFRIQLVIGDWSGDGHEITRSVTAHSNIPADELKAAYDLGVKATGVDLTRDVCSDYRDSSLSAEVLAKLVAAGYAIPGMENLSGNEIFDDTQYLDPEEFAGIWLFIARKGNPELRVDLVENDARINIGGYGLF